MENKERLEKQMCWKIANELKGLVSPDDISIFTYEMCFLRYLSLRTFKQIFSENKFSLSDFINEYIGHLKNLVAEDIMYLSVSEKETIEDLNTKYPEASDEVINSKYTEVSDEVINSKYLELQDTNFANLTPFIDLAKEVLDDLSRLQYSINDIRNILSILCSFNNSVIKNVMSLDLFENSRFTYQTPAPICKIINHVLDINGKDDILDLGSAYGNYLVNVNSCCDYNKLNGIEINKSLSLISRIRLMVLTNKADIKCEDMFNIEFDEKYDKIFCNYPWGYRVERYQLDYIHDRMNTMKFNWNKIGNASFDWVFIDIVLSLLKKNGIASVIMTPGPLFKVSDEQYRKDLIDSGLINSIIKLPVITRYTAIEQYLVVFSENNDKVRFVDISNQFTKGLYGQVSLQMNNIFELLNATEDTKNVRFISNKEISENGYLLKVENYVDKKEVKYFNPQKLSDYVIDVFRGYQITSKEQEQMQDDNGKYEILLISDINDGTISENLTRINSEEKKYDRYLLQENDLIISSKGTRIKIAVVNNIENRKIIASGNLIVLRLDSTRINPYYLEMYLNSQTGQTILNQIQTGSVIISINPSRLVDITISTLPIEEQNKLAEKYKSKKLQLQLAREHIKQIEEEQLNFFENEVEELFD